VAGVLAVHTDDEMRDDIIKPDIAVRDYDYKYYYYYYYLRDSMLMMMMILLILIIILIYIFRICMRFIRGRRAGRSHRRRDARRHNQARYRGTRLDSSSFSYVYYYCWDLKKCLSPGDFPRDPKTTGPDNKKTVTKQARYRGTRLFVFFFFFFLIVLLLLLVVFSYLYSCQSWPACWLSTPTTRCETTLSSQISRYASRFFFFFFFLLLGSKKTSFTWGLSQAPRFACCLSRCRFFY